MIALNSIAGYDLLSGADQALAFDYNGDGKQDLFLYRPGRGAGWVARLNGDGSFTSTRRLKYGYYLSIVLKRIRRLENGILT